MTRVQGYFGTPEDNTSVAHALASLGTELEGLALSPESPISRSRVLDAARAAAEDFNRYTKELQRQRLEADQRIGDALTDMNTYLSDMQDLNSQIAFGLSSGKPVGELQDQRDRLLAQLSELTDLRVFERSSGEISVFTESGRPLLDGAANPLSHQVATQVASSVVYGSGIAGISVGVAGPDITQEVRSGKLAALIHMRDVALPDLQSELDMLAETLRDTVNAVHNDGTAFPPPASLTGSRVVAAADAPAMTGTFRVAVTDADGLAVEVLDVNIGPAANIGAVVAAINGMANATAAIGADGRVTIAATGANRIAVNEMTSAVTSGSKTLGMSHFLGLNNLFEASESFILHTSDQVADSTAAVGLAGTLTFRHGGATTNVAYGAGDSLDDIATNITAALGGPNIVATVVREGDGFRMRLEDTDSDNFFISDSGTLASSLNLRAGFPGIAAGLSVATAISADYNRVSRAELSAGAIVVGNSVIGAGDTSVAERLADVFTSDASFGPAGALPAGNQRIADYAARIISFNATMTAGVSNNMASAESHRETLVSQAKSISQVNIDEEMANLVILQNTYAAAARITQTVSELMDTIVNLVR